MIKYNSIKLSIKVMLLCVSINAFGQNGITFEVEKLSKPKKTLLLRHHNDIYKNLILKDLSLSKWDIEQSGIDFKYDIITMSETPDSLVNYQYNSFFYGMYQAYADHRPFVLSPDMIWLLISQGFSRHVNANPEKLRHYFVDFSGKLTLMVEAKEDLITNPKKWEEIFPQFTAQISEHTGDELVKTLTSDFSTTTTVERIASEITIMEAMKPYFEYVVFYAVCGIPEITLQGTTEDWQKVLDKTKKLAKYDLEWWTSELEPLLKEFVNASQGKINKKFWRNMFKYHSQKKYGAPNIIDGWIVKFFPYDKDGKRNNLTKLVGRDILPDEIVKVDVKYVKTDGIHTEEIMLELWSGFIGLEQNPENFALTPKIGWMIKRKDVEEQGAFQKLEAGNNIPRSSYGGIDVRVIEVPKILKNLSEIYSLSLHFKEDVFIPDWLKEKRIGKLNIEGKITQAEINKIVQWFPNTDLNINDKKYNLGKNGWIVVSGNRIPNDVLMMDKIWILEIWNTEFNDDKLIIPDALKNIVIENLNLINKTSPENIEKLKILLPETKIFVNNRRIQ